MGTGAVQLMAHQEEGVQFLLGRKSGLLAFEQGLGKTFIAIEAFRRLFESGMADRLLVICPNSLKRNWVHEVAKFAGHLRTEIVEGSPKERRRLFSSVKAPVVIVSYDTARAEVAGVLSVMGKGRTVMVLDESHAVKNRYSLTSIATRHFAPRAEYRWLLSGTPITNTAADIYPQVNLVASSSPLGSYDSFVARYSEAENSEELAKRLAPYILRRTKDQCLDLPAKNFFDVRVELPAWQRKLYDDMRDALVCEIQAMSGEEFRAYAPTALAKLLRLSQLASNPALLLPTEPRVPAKFLELDELITEICASGAEKIILWSHYVKTIKSLIDRYAHLGTVALYGEVPSEERMAVADRFQNDPDTRLLVANPAAAGTGFTLTAACYAIYETLSWRYDYYAQSQDRNHRIGQTRPVTYIRLIAADTIEEAITAALERKSELARALLGDEGAPPSSASMSREQMCALLIKNEWPND
jgi:SNF2 family DNA or RNA helicase